MKRAIEIKSENINGWRQMRIKVKSSLGTMNLTQYGNVRFYDSSNFKNLKDKEKDLIDKIVDKELKIHAINNN